MKMAKDKNLRIHIGADSMRVGKTTAVQVIAAGFRDKGRAVIESYEDWQNNPFLKKSYADPAKNFLDSQKWFIKRKYEQISQELSDQVLIQDVPPEMDYCYAKTNLKLGRMSSEHFAKYDDFYQSFDWDKVNRPDLTIYLQVSDEVLIQRALDSLREFENIEPEYLLMMKKMNREWLEELGGQRKILVIDTDDFDFANDDGAKKKLVMLVTQSLLKSSQ